MKQKFAIVLSVLMLIASVDLAAQERSRHRRYHEFSAHGFGIDFGYVHSSYRTTDWATDEVETSAGLDGFKVGLTKDFRIVPEALYFQVGLNYIYQNDARNENISVPGIDNGLKIVGDRTEHYVALPLKLKYTYGITDRIGIAVEAGPTLLLGASSKMKYRTRFEDGQSSIVTYNIYKGEMDASQAAGDKFDLEDWMVTTGMLPEGSLKRFDVMLGASVGADFFNKLEVRLGYDWGLVNRYRKQLADDLKMRRGQFNLTVGVRF